MFGFRSSPSGDEYTRFFSRPCWVLSPVVEFPGSGAAGTAVLGVPGLDGFAGVGVGDGLATLGAATIDNTTIAGNSASTNDNDVDGMFSV